MGNVATETILTETIVKELGLVYGRSEWNENLLQATATRIVKTVEAANGVRVHQKVTNVIWNNFAGGDTAEKAATQVLAALKLAV